MCEWCIGSSYFKDVKMITKPAISYTKSQLFMWKKAQVRKFIVIFKAFWTSFLMVSIKITYDYFFKQKNRKKHVKNTQKSCFLHFFGLKFENFQNWIQRFDSIFKELLYAVFRLEKFLLLPEIYPKNWKILTSLKLNYPGNCTTDQFQNLISLSL